MIVDGEHLEVGPGAMIITNAGAYRGIEAKSRLVFIAARISRLTYGNFAYGHLTGVVSAVITAKNLSALV